MNKEMNDFNKLIDLFEKSLAVQLHENGVPRATIAKMIGKRAQWVNDFLKPLGSSKK